MDLGRGRGHADASPRPGAPLPGRPGYAGDHPLRQAGGAAPAGLGAAGEGEQPMTDGRGYELADATYPLRVDAGVTIPEEIRCLVDTGWTWDGNKLVHPGDKDIWRMYTKVDSSKIGD